MREIIKKSLSFFVAFLLLLITSCEGFNGINFNENIKEKINEDLAVTYHFYEYPDLNSSHIDRVFMISKTVSSSPLTSLRYSYILILNKSLPLRSKPVLLIVLNI